MKTINVYTHLLETYKFYPGPALNKIAIYCLLAIFRSQMRRKTVTSESTIIVIKTFMKLHFFFHNLQGFLNCLIPYMHFHVLIDLDSKSDFKCNFKITLAPFLCAEVVNGLLNYCQGMHKIFLWFKLIFISYIFGLTLWQYGL